MTRLRLWVSISFLWLALLFNIERLHEPFNIASFVYVLAAVLGMITVALPPLNRLDLVWTMLGATVILVATKGLLGYQVAGRMLPLTVTEAAAVSVTVLLARQIALSIQQFEESVFELAALHWVQRPLAFKEVQHDFYREVRRARQYRRPLALLALRPSASGASPTLNRLIEEVHKKMAQYHVEAQMANVLMSHLHDCELVAKMDEQFLVLLPEADQQRAQSVADHLASQIRDTLATEVHASIATFPSQETTLSGLVERAEAGVRFPSNDPPTPPAFDNAGKSSEAVLTTT